MASRHGGAFIEKGFLRIDVQLRHKLRLPLTAPRPSSFMKRESGLYYAGAPVHALAALCVSSHGLRSFPRLEQETRGTHQSLAQRHHALCQEEKNNLG